MQEYLNDDLQGLVDWIYCEARALNWDAPRFLPSVDEKNMTIERRRERQQIRETAAGFRIFFDALKKVAEADLGLALVIWDEVAPAGEVLPEFLEDHKTRKKVKYWEDQGAGRPPRRLDFLSGSDIFQLFGFAASAIVSRVKGAIGARLALILDAKKKAVPT